MVGFHQLIESGFNPRAHEGRDQGIVSSCTYWNVSTHAPTRGATQ